MTRKAFLGALLSQVTFAGLGGCGAAGGLPGGAPSVTGPDDALGLVLDSLGRRYGGSYVFRQVKLSHLRHVDLAPSVAVSEPPRMSAWRTL